MSFYINKLLNGEELPKVGKAELLIEKAGATLLGMPPLAYIKDLVCVFFDEGYEAAFVCENDNDYARCFNPDDHRVRFWLIVPGADRYAK